MFFTAAKLFWIVAAPSSMLLWLTILSGWAALTRGIGARLLPVITAIAWTGFALLPIGGWLAAPLEEQYAAGAVDRVDAIVVLGGSFDDVVGVGRSRIELNAAADRLTEGVALARLWPKAQLIFTGGSGRLIPGEWREGDAARAFFLAQGVAPGRLLIERDSRDTYENAVELARLRPQAPGEVWLLVTSALHMPRALATFRRAGLSVEPWPVDFRSLPVLSWRAIFDLPGNLALTDAAMREWIGLLAYRLAGRTGG